MFDYVRKHTKIMMGLLFVLIIPSFVLFGVDGYNRFNEKGAVVAKLAGQEITQAQWDASHKQEVDLLRISMPTLDAKLLDSPQARYATLERLVRERVLLVAADKSHLFTSDARLAKELQQNPAIASMRRPDGTLDIDRYRQLLSAQGMTPDMFEAQVRRDVSTRQLESGLIQSAFVVAAQADAALNAFYERREVQLTRFSGADFASQVNPTQDELQAFYQANQTLFQTREMASIEYLVLDLESVRKTIQINEADIKTYYEQNAARFSGSEERRASHILIAAPKEAPAADRAKALARAQELLQLARKAPASFAELARKNSQDTGSAASGGDLNYFARGAMVKPFEEAAFKMNKGDISEVVESDFGYHIIRLTDIKAPLQKSFEELRLTLESDLKTQQAQKKYAEAAEVFTNGVYEQSDTLKPVAERLKLEVKTATGLTRIAIQQNSGVLGNAKLLAAIFAPESLDKKRNTEAVELAPSQLAAARVTQYVPARTLPLSEVTQNVRERLIAARSAELAVKAGKEKLALWKANPDAAVLKPAFVMSRDQSQNAPPQLLDAVLRADASKLPQWVGVDLGAQGYVVARINKLIERDPSPEAKLKQDRAQYLQWWGNAENMAYYKLLQERYKVQIKVPKPALADLGLAQ
jgi:peptidyl-prolyl cis-trans isomerase D